MSTADEILQQAHALFARLDELDLDERIDTLNALRRDLHHHSPMRDEPVDCVEWIPAEQIQANDYNPNTVAKPEMELLTHSISADGYTQPIVAWPTSEQTHEVIDGFHRHLVGHTDAAIQARLHGRLPVTTINADRTDKPDRMAATIRHNRARGIHQVDPTSDIVIDMHRNYHKSDSWIARELGMEPDEVTRLRQVAGIAEMFADEEFSEAWEVVPFEPDTSA